jgi:hypothetical protein
MSDDDYRALQNHLLRDPLAGNQVQGSGGICKLRWKAEGRGKRGGVRILYFWITQQDQLFMRYVYPKNAQENLTQTQLALLKKTVATG